MFDPVRNESDHVLVAGKKRAKTALMQPVHSSMGTGNSPVKIIGILKFTKSDFVFPFISSCEVWQYNEDVVNR